MFRGSIVALVTPMHNNEVDIERLRELVEFHISEGTHAIVAAGTTGESGTLSLIEKSLVIKTVLEQTRERIPVIAGTGAISTTDAIQLTQVAMECGAYAALILTPPYIKPTQQGLYLHYSQIAKAVAIPIILYNAPGRTACDLLPETVNRLAQFSNIIGLKEAIGTTERLKSLIEICEDRIDIFSGDDATAAEWLVAGAKGVISVTANVVPRLMAKLCDAAQDGDSESCLYINQQLAPLHSYLFVEGSPIPVKWALYKMGLVESELRLPLTVLSEEYRQPLEQILKDLEVI